MNRFITALAALPRHRSASEIAPLLPRIKSSGFTGVWLENNDLDVPWDEPTGDDESRGNWKFFNLFDLTFGSHREFYLRYIKQLSEVLRNQGLHLCLSFWMPQLNPACLDYLRAHRPGALGVSKNHSGEPVPTLCTCRDGQGLAFIEEMIQTLYRVAPDFWGLKVATEDNNARICDENCPNAHGTSRRQHAGNLFSTIQRAMLKSNPASRFLVYPWFWGEGFDDEIISRLDDSFLIVTKFEVGSVQRIESAIPGEKLFDCSIVTEAPGDTFTKWRQRVGPGRLIDMLPLGTGIDDFFLANPPYPGRLFRRLTTLRSLGVTSFLDFDCSGYCVGAAQDVVRILKELPAPTEDDLLKKLAEERSPSQESQVHAVRGWRAFDRGFAGLPIGLGQVEQVQFSGRFGFAWSMCIATPLLPQFIGGDRHHEIHWFSPYNFFTPQSATRLGFHFSKVLGHWQEAAQALAIAALLAPESELAARDALSAKAHVISVRSVLNWAMAPALLATESRLFSDLMRSELELTETFAALVAEHPWAWANNCWHPHRTPLSQRFAGVEPAASKDTFAAKMEVMRREIAHGKS